MMRKLAIGVMLLAASVAAALAIQPGTTGTEKRFQEQGLRSGVLIQKNNTATATAGAATLNAAGSGIVTSEALTSAAGSPYVLTLTNNMITTTDIVMASVQMATATTGNPYIRRITPGQGSVVISVGNSTENSPAVFNGTLKISFWVLKQSVNGAD